MLKRRLTKPVLVPILGEFRQASIRAKLIGVLVPLVALVLAVTGAVSYFITYDYVTIALRRNAMVHNLATAEAVRNLLENSRKDVAFIAQSSIAEEALLTHLSRKAQAGEHPYLAGGMLRKNGEGTLVLAGTDGKYRSMALPAGREMVPAPYAIFRQAAEMPAGHIWISPLATVHLPDPEGAVSSAMLDMPAITLAAMGRSADGELAVYFVMLDGRAVRNVLSLYGSEASPIHAFIRTQEVRYSYLFDLDGWILFQSEQVDTPDVPLSTYLARSAKTGTLGQPALDCAFRPEADDHFWHMLAEVRQGRQGILEDSRPPLLHAQLKEISTAYAPVFFRPAPDAPPYVYAGLAFYDVSRLTLAAGYKHVDVMFVVVLCAGIVAAILIFWVSQILTRSLRRIISAAETVHATGTLDPIDVSAQGYEARLLENALNSMLATIREQFAEIERKDKTLRDVGRRERMPQESAVVQHSNTSRLMPRIIGAGAVMEALRRDILKAAQVDVDVLITGETGTGKQLAAEAIHLNSRRADNPFISINCGELDENLLIDTLFGHVRGAFTEARGDRPGAFREAEGGTLFLDEIQLASSRVQQALLRALSMRVIKPLGSDRELPVNVRVVAATNADLRTLCAEGRFREDLYFRLNVITIATPPLRSHPENILPIASHYLSEMSEQTGREHLALSRGAVEKLTAYTWPGNIRELKNAIIRAVVMSNHEVIQADCLVLDGQSSGNGPEILRGMRDTSAPEFETTAAARDAGDSALPARTGAAAQVGTPAGLSARQRVGWAVLLRQGEITRREYEESVGGGIATRTALYDLQDMVRKGLVERTGSGPGTVYRLREDVMR